MRKGLLRGFSRKSKPNKSPGTKHKTPSSHTINSEVSDISTHTLSQVDEDHMIGENTPRGNALRGMASSGSHKTAASTQATGTDEPYLFDKWDVSQLAMATSTENITPFVAPADRKASVVSNVGEGDTNTTRRLSLSKSLDSLIHTVRSVKAPSVEEAKWHLNPVVGEEDEGRISSTNELKTYGSEEAVVVRPRNKHRSNTNGITEEEKEEIKNKRRSILVDLLPSKKDKGLKRGTNSFKSREPPSRYSEKFGTHSPRLDSDSNTDGAIDIPLTSMSVDSISSKKSGRMIGRSLSVKPKIQRPRGVSDVSRKGRETNIREMGSCESDTSWASRIGSTENAGDSDSMQKIHTLDEWFTILDESEELDAVADVYAKYKGKHWSEIISPEKVAEITPDEQKQYEVTWELLSTEFGYHGHCRHVVKGFLSSLDVLRSEGFISNINSKKMFTNIEQVYEAAELMAGRLHLVLAPDSRSDSRTATEQPVETLIDTTHTQARPHEHTQRLSTFRMSSIDEDTNNSGKAEAVHADASARQTVSSTDTGGDVPAVVDSCVVKCSDTDSGDVQLASKPQEGAQVQSELSDDSIPTSQGQSSGQSDHAITFHDSVTKVESVTFADTIASGAGVETILEGQEQGQTLDVTNRRGPGSLNSEELYLGRKHSEASSKSLLAERQRTILAQSDSTNSLYRRYSEGLHQNKNRVEFDLPSVSASEVEDNGIAKTEGDASNNEAVRQALLAGVKIRAHGGNTLKRTMTSKEKRQSQAMYSQNSIESIGLDVLRSPIDETDFLNPWRVVEAFKDFEAITQPLIPYCINHVDSVKFVKTNFNQNAASDFCKIIRWNEKKPQCDRLSLADLLVKPMQRLTKYPLLLSTLRKRCKEDPALCTELDKCIAVCERVLHKVNERVRDTDNLATITALKAQLVLTDNAKLLDLTLQRLWYNGALVHQTTTRTLELDVYLFENIILLTRPSKLSSTGKDKNFVFKQPIILSRCDVSKGSSEDIIQLTYASTSGQSTLNFTAPGVYEARQWIEEIHTAKARRVNSEIKASVALQMVKDRILQTLPELTTEIENALNTLSGYLITHDT